jgi:hypothetical protein
MKEDSVTRFQPGMNPRLKRVFVCLISFAALGFMVFTTPDAKERPSPKDGELAWRARYQSWPKFLAAIQRSDAKQIRDIYINPQGAKAVTGQPFPDAARNN